MEISYYSLNSCYECGDKNNIHHHHIVPKVLGGLKTIPLCVKCHGLVHNKDFTKSINLQKIGIAKAKARGVYKTNGGKLKETTEQFLSKLKVKKACYYLFIENMSYRKTALFSELSMGTVQKIVSLLTHEQGVSIGQNYFLENNITSNDLIEIDLLRKKVNKKEQLYFKELFNNQNK